MADAMTKAFELERAIFGENYAAWSQSPSHAGRFVLIKNREVIGFYDSLDAAFSAGADKFGLDDFFIEQIAPPAHTNVTFLGQRF